MNYCAIIKLYFESQALVVVDAAVVVAEGVASVLSSGRGLLRVEIYRYARMQVWIEPFVDYSTVKVQGRGNRLASGCQYKVYIYIVSY